MTVTASANRTRKPERGCYRCRGRETVAVQTVRYFSPAGKAPLYIENLPVKECRVCGVIVFPVPSRTALQRGRAGAIPPFHHQSLPVFDLQNPHGKPAARPSRCYNCRSRDREEKQIILRIDPDGRHPRAVKNLPAAVCRVCGPTGFSGKVMDTLGKIREGQATPVAYQSIPVFDLQNPQARPEKAKAAAAPTYAKSRALNEPAGD